MNPSADHSSAHQRFPSGIDGIDTILGGGFMLGGIYIVQGPPGAGKTILTNQICFNHVASGGRATYVTLLAENHARMLNNMRLLSFFDESAIPDRLVYLSAFAEMRDGGMSALLNLLRREVQQRRTSLLVIDGLVSVHALARTEQEFKQFVHDLQEIALATDCTMFVTTNDTRHLAPERTMVDGLIVLSETLRGWQAVSDLQVTKFRGGAYLRGRHAYQIDTTGISVYPRIEALLDHPSQPEQVVERRVTSGIGHLDPILGDGLPYGSTTLLVGPSGIGKTTMGLQFLAHSSQAEPGLLVGFHETPSRLRLKAEQLDPALGALCDAGIVEVQWHGPGGDLLDAYGHRLLDAVRSRGVKRLFIDGLTAFQRSESDTVRSSSFFTALSNELRALGVTTVYTLEVPDIQGAAVRLPIQNASSLAENIVLLRFVEAGTRLHRLVSILKMRDSAFDPSLFEFTIDRGGVQVDPDGGRVQELLGRSSSTGGPPRRGDA